MATAIVDLFFREVAISYLGRGDLAHVQPGDLAPDTIGKGVGEGMRLGRDDLRPEVSAQLAAIQKGISQGFVRNKFTVVPGGMAAGNMAGGSGSPVSAVATQAVPTSMATSAVALSTVVDEHGHVHTHAHTDTA